MKPLCPLFLFIALALKLTAQSIDIPSIDSLSVDQTKNTVFVSWKVNNPSALDGYIIYRRIFGWPKVMDGAFMPIDTLFSPASLFYEDNSVVYGKCNPALRAEEYQVAAFKIEAGILKLSTSSLSHLTILARPIKFLPCNALNIINWDKYGGWNVDCYLIFYKNSLNNRFQILAKVSATESSYTHQNLTENITYEYYIRAIHKNGIASSTSNLVSQLTTMDKPANTLVINNITTENNSLQLNLTIDKTAPVKFYKILRADSLNGKYDSIATFSNQNEKIEYIDKTTKTGKVYFYKFVVVNRCGIEFKTSEISNNVVLTAQLDQTKQSLVSLNWNNYAYWNSGIKQYVLYRTIENQQTQEISTQTAPTLSYLDDLNKISNGNPNESASSYCYQIEAISNELALDGNNYKSKSNVACISKDINIKVPNAFNPNSTIEGNRTFRPQNINTDKYKLIIFNRWGMPVFSSEEINTGWDGKTKNGELAPTGVYTYIIEVVVNGKRAEKSGFVTLINH